MIFFLAAVVMLIGAVFLIRKNVGLEKQVFLLMQRKGSAVVSSRATITEINTLQNTVSPILEVYINGPDTTTMRPRRMHSPYHYVKMPDGGVLFDVWIAKDTVRSENTLHVAIIKDAKIQNIVRATDYLANSGEFNGLANITFENSHQKLA